MSQSIVVPIDGSKYSSLALKYAAQIAKENKYKLIVVNVQPSVKDRSCESTPYQEAGKKVLSVASEFLKSQSVDHEICVRFGLPTIEICKVAEEKNAKCIIMGTRGLGIDVSKALGSVSYGVAQLTPCPVTFVPACFSEKSIYANDRETLS